MPTEVRIKGNVDQQPLKQKQIDLDGETDAETAASTPARSSVSSPNFEVEELLSSKNVATLPSLIDTSTSRESANAEKKNPDEDYKNWPLSDIKDPHQNDVLYGRGGGTNHHPGNKRYRKLVDARKVDYVNSKRLDKPLVALEIIKTWRSQKPPGRFLKLEESTSLWHDVGDKKAREKTSQALREKAPQLRKQQEEQKKERENISSGKCKGTSENKKSTRFDVPSQVKTNKNLKRVVLARDHSLGRDYISPDEPVSVKGFSWNSPIAHSPTIEEIHQSSWDGSVDRGSADGSSRGNPDAFVERDAYGVSPYSATSPSRYNDGWNSSSNIHHPRTPNDPVLNDWRAGYKTDDGPRKDYSTNYDYRRTRSADDRYYNNKRGYYPNTGVHQSPHHVQSDDYKRFANIVGEGSSNTTNYMQNWKSMNSPRSHSDRMYDTSPYQSPDRMNPVASSGYGRHWNSPSTKTHTSPPRSVDYYNNNPYRPEGQNFSQRYTPSNDIYSSSSINEGIPRPPNVKRDTSHKLQTGDVEPTTKRLNRQTSHGRRSSVSSIEEITEKDMNHLNVSLKRSALGNSDQAPNSSPSPRPSPTPSKPQSMKETDRVSTIDKFFVDMDVPAVPDSSRLSNSKPRAMNHGDRATTIDQINLLVKDIDGTSYLDGLSTSLHGSEDGGKDSGAISKPSPLDESDRFNTFGTLDSTDLFGGLSHTAPV